MKKKMTVIMITTWLCANLYAVKDEQKAAYEMYGLAHISIDFLDDDQTKSVYLSSNSSRIGWKGTLLLNTMIKAIWKVECDAVLDEGSGVFASRNAYVGLSSIYGNIIGGRHDTPFEILSDKLALFRDQIGDARNIIGNQGAGWNLRTNNIIAYQSPEVWGISVFAMYSPEDGVDQNDLSGVSAEYRKGGLFLTIAGERHGRGMTASIEKAYETVSNDRDPLTSQYLLVEYPAVSTLSKKNETGIRIGGSYTWQDLKFTALYEILRDVGGVSGTHSHAWGTGITYRYKKHRAKAQYYTSNGIAGKEHHGSGMFAFGYDYTLAESTKLYVAYASAINEAYAASGMSLAGRGDGAEPASGKDPSGLSLGIVYSF